MDHALLAVRYELTNVLNIEEALIIDDGLIPGAKLDTVRDPDGCVVLVEKALIRPLSAVVRALFPIFRKFSEWPAMWVRGNSTQVSLKIFYSIKQYYI